MHASIEVDEDDQPACLTYAKQGKIGMNRSPRHLRKGNIRGGSKKGQTRMNIYISPWIQKRDS